MAGGANVAEDRDNEQKMILVPRRPTKEMLEAAWADALAEDAAGVWAAMIASWLGRQNREVG